jgi:hypothetical protein
MFGFFKKTSPLEKLQKKYQAAIEESFRLSKTDRKASDQKQVEAGEILKEIDLLDSPS